MTTGTVPLPRTPALLVQQAARLLRAGEPVTIRAGEAELRVRSTEAGGDPTPWPAGSTIVITGRRLAALVQGRNDGPAWEVALDRDTSPVVITALADPTAAPQRGLAQLLRRAVPARELAAGGVELAKLAGLLPAAVCLPPSHQPGGAAVRLGAIRDYRELEATSLQPVSEARVPLADAENARIVAFRPSDGGPEQFAILVGEPDEASAPLCRLHSECFTGDLLGSLRCDCGDQLRGAIRRMAQEGAGVLLYLAQEGRGIGLANKLRAYALQDTGLDTVDANTHLGFEPDERGYHMAATMLRHLGIGHVRLLTNNPAKVQQLSAYGIEVVERVPHIFEPNAHNAGYLRTKGLRSGHLLDHDGMELSGSPFARG